jgi:hypothetical protein
MRAAPRGRLAVALLAAALVEVVAPAGRDPRAAAAGAAGEAAVAAPERWFADVAREAGVERAHSRRRFHNPYAAIMEGYTALGAAAAVADFDGDGDEDLFVTDSAADGKNRLYRNDGGFAFTEVAAAAGVADGNDAANASTDALFFDYDGDGRPDLFVVRFGVSRLYKNLGGGRFGDVTREAGLDRYANAITAVAFDADRDGRLDLLVGGYFRPIDLFRPSTPRFLPESLETAANGGGLALYRNEGPDRDRPDGAVTFTDATARAGLATGGWTLDVGHADADGDGDEDLYVACDFGSDRFFLNDGDGTFTDSTAAAIGIDTKKGMNAEWGDYDDDGRLDVFVTNITDDYMREGNFLWHNDGPDAEGRVRFTDLARETGTHDAGWAWGGKFLDYDNDGRLDLYVANGWVSAGPESFVPELFAAIARPDVDLADVRNWPPMGGKSLSGYQQNRLFHNAGGQLFRDQAARHGLDSTRDGRGVAVADFDGDGRLDLYVANAGAPPHLYRNLLPTGAHWLALALVGTRSNRDAVGAQARLTAGGVTRLRFVDGGNGFGAQSSKRLHFGLGTATGAERLEIRWPSGLRQSFGPLAADRLYRIVEGEPEAEPLAGGDGAAAPLRPDYRRGMDAAAAGDCAAALPALEAAVEADPESRRYASDYRRTVIRCGEYDRAIALFERLAAAHPGSANVLLNHGYAYVDKIPAAGSVSQVILAGKALERFTAALELERSWLALYTRGNSYLYWPRVFGRGPLAVADLEAAVELSRGRPDLAVYGRAYAALGDAYWRTGQPDRARAIWREGLARFPGEARIAARTALDGEELDRYIYDQLDPNLRVDTDLSPLWEEP